MNFILAITGRNIAEDLNKIVFERMDEVLNLYAPDVNKKPHPNFKSIMEGFRELDKNPEEAVINNIYRKDYVHLQEG